MEYRPTCSKCGIIFSRIRYLAEHNKQFPNCTTQKQCHRCNIIFKTSRQLAYHLARNVICEPNPNIQPLLVTFLEQPGLDNIDQ